MEGVVTALQVVRPGRAARTIEIDGEPWLVVSRTVLAKVGVSVGDRPDLEALRQRVAELAAPLARERALKLLGVRDYTTGEMERRLVDDGFEASSSRGVVEDLASAGLIDDARFARARARTFASRGYGPSRIRQELARHLLPRDLIDLAAGAAIPEDALRENADALAAKLARGGRQDPVRLARRISARGYPPGVARDAALRFAKAQGDDGSDAKTDFEADLG